LQVIGELDGKCTLTVIENPSASDRIGTLTISYKLSSTSSTTHDDVFVIIQPKTLCIDPKQGARGKEFFVTFMENEGSWFENPTTLSIFATTDTATQYTITQMYDGSQYALSYLPLEANTVTEIYKNHKGKADHESSTTSPYNYQAEKVTKRSLYITSVKPMSLFAYNAVFQTSETSHVIPVDALGDEYFHVSYPGNSGDYNFVQTSEMFVVVATKDGTLVTITPTAITDGPTAGASNSDDDLPAGVPFTVRLNKGETYLVKSKEMVRTNSSTNNNYITTFSPNDLTGTHIKANKPIAVFSGHERAAVGCAAGGGNRDNLYEQLLPLHSWGKRYAIVNTTGHVSDLYRIVAAHDGTTVTITDKRGAAVETYSLNSGEFKEVDFVSSNSEYAYIEATNPVEVMLFAKSVSCIGGSGDPFMIAASPIDVGTPRIIFTPVKLINPSTGGTHYSTIIVETAYKDSTKLETCGASNIVSPIPLSFIEMPNTRYSYAINNLGTTYNPLLNYRLTNPYGLTAYSYSYGDAESAGCMLGGQYGTKAEEDPEILDYCVGQTTTTLPQCADGAATCTDDMKFFWYNNVSDWSTGNPRAAPPSFSLANDTSFRFYKSRKISCGISYPQDVLVTVHAPDAVTFDDDTVCLSMSSDSTDYGALPKGGVYTFASGVHAGQLFAHKTAGEGTHAVKYTYTSQYGCITEQTANITVEAYHPTITTSLISSSISFCRGEEVKLEVGSISSSNRHTYQWYYGGAAITPGGNGNRYELKPSAAVYAAGVYSVEATSVVRGCVSTATATVEMVEKPGKPEVATMEGTIDICVGGGFKLYDYSYIFPVDDDSVRYQWYETSVSDLNKRGISNTYIESQAMQDGDRRFILGAKNPVLGHTPAHPGCWSYDTIDITVHPLPYTATIYSGSANNLIYNDTIRLCENDTVNLVPGGGGSGSAYLWSRTTANGTMENYVESPQITVKTAGTYSVTSKSTYGCLASAKSNHVTVAFVARPETPTLLGGAPVCTGNATFIQTITTAATTSYQWYVVANNIYSSIDGATASSYGATANGSYAARAYIDYSNGLRCPSLLPSQPLTVSLWPKPSQPTIMGATNVCAGTDILLTASLETGSATVTKYRWYKGGVQLSGEGIAGILRRSQAEPSAAYTVVAISEPDGNECLSTASNVATVIVHSPTVTITNAAEVDTCLGTDVKLEAATTASVGYTCEWYKDDVVLIGSGGPTYVVDGQTTASAARYSLYITDNYGCKSPQSNTVTVRIHAATTNITIPPVDVCTGADLTLTTSAISSSYDWYFENNGALTSLGTTGTGSFTIPNATPSHGGKYTVRIGNANGCISEGSGTAQVFPPPNKPIITPDAEHICLGDSTRLVASSDVGIPVYEWFFTGDGGIKSSLLPTSNTIYAKQSGAYTSRVRSATGCWSAESANMNVATYAKPEPPTIITPGNPIKICSNSATPIEASSAGATSYQWYMGTSPINGATSATYSVAEAGVYSALAYRFWPAGALTCPSVSTGPAKQVDFTPVPPRPVIEGESSACAGDTIILIAKPETTGPAMTSYEWYKGSSRIQAYTGDTCLVTQPEDVSYTVRGVSVDGCASPFSYAKQVSIRRPTVNIVNSDTTICHGGTVTLTSTTDAVITSRYEWYENGNPNPIPNANAQSYLVQSDGSPTVDKISTYTLYVIDGGGCRSTYASNAVQVSIRGLPRTPAVASPAPECEGGSVTLTASPSGEGTYQWYFDNNGALSPVGQPSNDTALRLTNVQPSSAGAYKVRITNTWECTSEGWGTVAVHPAPQNPTLSTLQNSMLTSGDTLHLCAGDSIQLTAYTINAQSYEWFYNGADLHQSADRLYANKTGVYSARSISEYSCYSPGVGAVAVRIRNNPEIPLIFPDGDINACVNGSTAITAMSSNATSFQWYTVDPFNGSRYLINGETDRVYRVGTSGSYAVRADILHSAGSSQLTCYSFSAPKSVELRPQPPRPLIAGKSTVCAGDTVTLRATLAYTNAVIASYRWYRNGAPMFSTSVDTCAIPQEENSAYTVQVISNQGCESEESLPQDVSTRRPAVNIVTGENVSTNICFGGTVLLTAVTNDPTASYTYEWYENNRRIDNANAESYLARSEGSPTVGKTSEYHVYVVDEWKCRSANPSNTVPITLRELPPTPVVTSPPPECEGGSVALKVSPSGAGTYSWFVDNNGTLTPVGSPSNDTVYEIAYVQPSHKGRYVARITNDKRCSSEGRGEVNVYDAATTPMLNVGDSAHLCTGDSTLLTAYAANVDHYEWYFNGGNLQLSADRLYAKMSGTYSVWGVSEHSCKSRGSDAVELILHERPKTPTITPDGLIRVCANGSVTIRGSAFNATSYQWYTVNPLTDDRSIINGATRNEYEVRESGHYAVRADVFYSAYGLTCETRSEPKEVELLPVLMQPVVTGKQTPTGEKTSGCEGDVITLTAAVPGNPNVAAYKWYRNGTEVPSVVTDTFTITQVETAVYTVEAVSDKNCHSEASNPKDVVIWKRPTVAIADGVRETCGSAITLEAVTNPVSTGGTYSWYENTVPIPGTSTSSKYTVQGNVDVTAEKNAKYYLFVTDRNGCSSAAASNTVEVTIHGLPPAPVVPAELHVCEKEDITLWVSPSGAGDYRWYKRNGRTFDTLDVRPDTSFRILSTEVADGGVYAVEITNTHGCTSTTKGEILLSVLTLPIVNILETRACASWTEEKTVNFAEPAGGAFTGWGCTDSGKFVPANVNPGEAAVTYTYRDPKGCINSDTKTIKVIRHPNTPVVTAKGSTAVCQDSVEVTLQVNVPAASTEADSDRYAYTYQWLREGSELPNESGLTYMATKEGAYSVRVCNQGLCWAAEPSIPVQVTVIPQPEPPVIATQSALICPGDVTQLFVQEGKGSYQWYKGDSKTMHEIAGEITATYNAGEVGQYAAGLFKFSEEWEVGCWSELSNFITVGERPLPSQPEIIPSQANLYAGLDYKLTVKTPQASEVYEWYKNDLSIDFTNLTFPIHNLNGDDTGRYTVRAVNEYGCHAWSEPYALAWSEGALFVPNIFTPNGDGINDYFQILGLEKFVENKLEILNKVGVIIFSQKNYHNEWNGNGWPNDVYYYTLELKREDGTKSFLHGYLHLKR
jgi:gliding motility-associated-like protein